MRQRGFSRGFTMIELLVVIVIVGVLAAALAPAVARFLRVGDDVVSRNNLMRLGRAAIAYRSEHNSCYPSAGGHCSEFTYRDDDRRETRYGRSRGWVYFEHSCPRSKGDEEDSIGDGNGDGYGCGGLTSASNSGDDDEQTASGTYVNEEGCCICFDSKTSKGGISPKPAGWRTTSEGGEMWGQAQVAIMNGCLYDYLGKDLTAYVNPAFVNRAVEKLGVSKRSVVRAYAMNVVTGADREIYDTRAGYSSGGGNNAIRYGQSNLRPYVDASTRSEALPARVALFVELDVDNSALKDANALEGDQVWDWDEGDESMGFVHEDNGRMYAHVCFADGHVEAIADPSRDIDNPDTARRVKLSKWYGSGGVNASGEKME